MIDLLFFFENYDKESTHHRAAVIELQRNMPKHLLDEAANWVDIYEGKDSEWHRPL